MNTTTTTDTSHCIDVCNSLLRGEISAVETYGKAIDKFSGDPEAPKLIQIRDEHQRAVDLLREDVRRMGGTPDTDSGAWGAFANTVQGAANLFGENSALGALKQGEEHGRNDYERALADDRVLPECKDLIRTELMPRCSQHIATLDMLADANR